MANPFAQAAALLAGRGTKSIATSQLLPAFRDNVPHYNEWHSDRAVKDGFKASSWVYACVTRLMEAISSVPWVMHEKDTTSREWVPIHEHPAQLLLEKPNPFMSREDLMQRFTSHLYLGGNGLFTKITVNGNVLAELWPLDPSGLRVVPSKAKFIDRYEYDKDGVKHIFRPDAVIHAMFVDPANPYWGMSPLQAVARAVDSDVEAVKWNFISLQNRARPDGVFVVKNLTTREQWEEARDMIKEQYLGPDNARTPFVLGGEAEWKPLALSPAEMDFLESRKFTREEICAVYHVPPPVAGILDNATLANIETARKIFWLDTVIPVLTQIRAVFNRTITPHFGPASQLWLNYDLSGVDAVRDNLDVKLESAAKLWSMGVPLSQLNTLLELGLEEFEGWDISYLPSSMVPAAMAGLMAAGGLMGGEEEGGEA